MRRLKPFFFYSLVYAVIMFDLAFPLSSLCARFDVLFMWTEMPHLTLSRRWDTPFPLIHERFYIPDYLRVFEGINSTMKY